MKVDLSRILIREEIFNEILKYQTKERPEKTLSIVIDDLLEYALVKLKQYNG